MLKKKAYMMRERHLKRRVINGMYDVLTVSRLAKIKHRLYEQILRKC
jgi:hypothetical protein